MKMKRLLVVVSMLAVMFSLSGCGEEKEKPFDYNDTDIVIDTMNLFSEYVGVTDEYAKYYLSDGTDFEKSAIKGIQQAQDTDKVGEFQDYSDLDTAIQNGVFSPDSVGYSIEETEEYVSVSIINKAADRDVEITVKYVINSDYYIQLDKICQEVNVDTVTAEIEASGYPTEQFFVMYGCTSIEELVDIIIEMNMESLSMSPYVPEEMVVTAVYSKGELMKQAGINTLIGMGTVFIVLIFISFIISLFKYLPALFAKKATVPEPKEAPKAVATPAAPVSKASDDLMNDKELVAVITAAIYAASASSGNGAVSKDRLVVRSIRRAKK